MTYGKGRDQQRNTKTRCQIVTCSGLRRYAKRLIEIHTSYLDFILHKHPVSIEDERARVSTSRLILYPKPPSSSTYSWCQNGMSIVYECLVDGKKVNNPFT